MQLYNCTKVHLAPNPSKYFLRLFLLFIIISGGKKKKNNPAKTHLARQIQALISPAIV